MENINENDKLLIINDLSAIRADKVTNYTCKSGMFGGIDVLFYFGTEWSHIVECDSKEEAVKLIKRYKKLIGVNDE